METNEEDGYYDETGDLVNEEEQGGEEDQGVEEEEEEEENIESQAYDENVYYTSREEQRQEVQETDIEESNNNLAPVINVRGEKSESNGKERKSGSVDESPNPIAKSKAGLTLEDIRAKLGVLSASSPSAKGLTIQKQRGNPDEDLQRLSQYYKDPSHAKLMNLCFELLEFTHLLENSRADTAKAWMEKSQVVRQFERLYDSVRDRESLFRGTIADQRKKFNIREGKYLNLRKRARQHLREWQTDRDRFFVETRAANEKIVRLQDELTNITQVISEQKTELSELRTKAKNMPSEKETTDYNLKLRSLQNENAQLLTERATLKSILDDLAATLQKRLPSATTPESSLTQVLNTGTDARSPKGEDPKLLARERITAEVAQLEKTVEEQQRKIELHSLAFESEMQELQRLRDEFLEYKEVLESMVQPAEEAENGEEVENDESVENRGQASEETEYEDAAELERQATGEAENDETIEQERQVSGEDEYDETMEDEGQVSGEAEYEGDDAQSIEPEDS